MRRFGILLLLTGTLVLASARAWAADPLVQRFLESRQVVSTVFFNSNSYQLSTEERTQLVMLLDDLKKEVARGRFIRVEGFASDEGQQVYSFKLSLQRAKAVLDFLTQLGGLPEIFLTGYGDLQADGSASRDEWRVEIATYENVIDVRIPRPAHTIGTSAGQGDSPISNRSLLQFKQGDMQAITRFDEPLIIDAYAIDRMLMEKVGRIPLPDTADSVTRIDWSEPLTSLDYTAIPGQKGAAVQ
ncbi:MAG: OmpA family protein [Desulfuromonadales bacterium]|nr:OmpA family protein [Desulfuromonadales bacterium]